MPYRSRYPEVVEGGYSWDGQRVFIGPADEPERMTFRAEVDRRLVSAAVLDALDALERACIDELRQVAPPPSLALLKGA